MTGPDTIVEQCWPYDGPHSADSVTTAAAAINDLARYLANATRSTLAADPLAYASTIDRIIGELGGAVDRLDQVLAQLAARMSRFADDPSLYDDRAYTDHQRAAKTATDAAAWLSCVRDDVLRVVGDLSYAQARTSHLGNTRQVRR